MRMRNARTNVERSGRERRAYAQVTLARALLILVGLIPLILASCGTDSVSSSSPAKDQTFTWPYTGGKKINYDEMLDPASTSQYDDTATVQMLFTGLVKQDRDLKVAPDAATSWDVGQSGTLYTFHLRPNMRFSDGQPLTAKDFAYSIDRALDPRLCEKFDSDTYGPNATDTCDSTLAFAYIGNIVGAGAKQGATGNNVPSLISNGNDPNKGLNVIDPLTLQIRLDTPVSFFLEALTYPTALVLEQSFVENPQWAGGKWVDHLDQGGCSGPFKVQSYGNGEQMTMVPNSAWGDAWGKQIQLKQVVRPVVADAGDAYNNYRAGKYDYVVVPGSSYNTASGQGDFHELPTLITRFFGMNLNKAPFNNLQVRQAFALSLNKQILVDRIESGAAAPSNHFVPRGMPGYNAGLKNPPPDATQSLTGSQAAAISLLKKAQDSCPASGIFTDKKYDYCRYIVGKAPLEIDFYVRDNQPASVALTRTAADQWSAALGLNVKALLVDRNTLFANLRAKPNPLQGWNFAWIADYPDPQDFLSNFFRSGATYNYTGISDPALDKLLDDADKELNFDKRMVMYNQAEQFVIDNVGILPLQQEKFIWRQRPWVSGFALTTLGLMVDTNWPNVVILTH
jgi:oligopeptide transport system substrate-binding protein